MKTFIASTAAALVIAAPALAFAQTANHGLTRAQVIQELVDLEDWFQQWRFRHMTTVKRIIGFKRGTGGTQGVGYLQAMLQTKLFPELWDVRTAL